MKIEDTRVRAQRAPTFGYQSCSLVRHWFHPKVNEQISPLKTAEGCWKSGSKGSAYRALLLLWLAGGVEDFRITQIAT